MFARELENALLTLAVTEIFMIVFLFPSISYPSPLKKIQTMYIIV